MGTVILEDAIDSRIIDALAEAGIDKLDSESLEFQAPEDADFEYVRLYSK